MRDNEPPRRVPRVSGSRRRLALALLLSLLAPFPGRLLAHDIPNARVDRSTQVIVSPGRLRIAYEVSLSELTLTQELRSLVGDLPGGDRRAWFEAYGRETGPLNAKGFLVSVGGEPVALRCVGFDLVVEEHPRFTFRFSAPILDRGRLRVRDANFSSSEGTCRLAVRGEGVFVRGDDLPGDLNAIPARPVWQLTDAEERRTREVLVEYGPATGPTFRTPESSGKAPVRAESPIHLSRLLDGAPRLPRLWLGLIALGLGAAHAVQPGHGKTIVAAAVLSEGGDWRRGALLAVVTTATHMGSVFLVAGGLWWTDSLRFGTVHHALARSAGFVLAAVGVWRLGRHFAGHPEHERDREAKFTNRGGGRSVLGLGVAGGLVPCWDAVGLIVLAAAMGRLGLGLALASAFSLGMGLVLVAVGLLATRLGRSLGQGSSGLAWERRLGLAGGLVLAGMGLALLRF